MIGVFGGTFDPVHFGHLRSVLEVAEACQMQRVHLIPGHVPPHRPQPAATSTHRLAMLQRAIEHEPRLIADEREIRRSGASYSVDTLASIRAEIEQHAALSFIMGLDAFLAFQSWYRWQDILLLAHLVVMQRPGYQWDSQANPVWFADRLVLAEQLQYHPYGKIAFQTVTPLAISATLIRQCCQQGRSVRYLLPDPVLAYLQEQNLYEIKKE